MKTITRKLIALLLVVSGIIFSNSVLAACNVPTGLNTTAITSTTAVLNWTAPSGGAQSYNVRYRVVSTSIWTTATSTTVSKSISSLTGSTAYEWQVQSKCSGTQTSSWTSSSTFTTLVLCNTPTGLNTTSITSTGATLNWTAVSGASNYNVQYRVVGAPSWISTTSTTTSKAITSLTSSSNYEWQVQTNCGSSNLSVFSSSATFATQAPPCNVPSGLNTTGITSTGATLNWSAASGAVSYNLQYRIVGAPSWISTTSTTTSKAITSLTSSSNYEWQVQTNCGSSNLSAFSSSATFATQTPCNVPSGLNAAGITSSGATLNWSAVSGAHAYNIQYRAVGTPSWIAVTTTTASIIISVLTPSTNYEWQVQTDCGSSSISTFSSSNTFTTIAPVITIVHNMLDPQSRLHDMQMCYKYFQTILDPEVLLKVDDEISNLLTTVTPVTPSLFDFYIAQNPADPDVMAYLKVLATYTKPVYFLSRDLTPQDISIILNSLSIYENTISNKL